MPAVQETIDRVRKIDVDQYKYGFETLIEMDKAPKGLNEDIIRLISAKKGEPRVDARMAARSVPPLAARSRSRPGRASTIRRSISRTSTTTPRRRATPGRPRSTRSIRSC